MARHERTVYGEVKGNDSERSQQFMQGDFVT